MQGQIKRGREFNKAFHIGGANRIFEPQVVKLIEQPAYLKSFEAVVLLHGIVREDILIAQSLTQLFDLFHVANVRGDGRSFFMLTGAGMNFIARIAFLLSLHGIGHVVFYGGEMLRTGISHHAVFGAAEDLIDGPVDSLAQDVPKADVGGSGLVVGPGSTAAIGHGNKVSATAAGPGSALSSACTTSAACSSAGPRAKATCTTHTGGGIQRGQQIHHVLTNQRNFRPFEPARSAVAIADSVVTFDAAVRYHGDDFTRLSGVEAVNVGRVGDVDLNLFHRKIGHVALLNADGLRGGNSGIG